MEFYKRMGCHRRRRFRRLEELGMDGEEDMERKRKRRLHVDRQRKAVQTMAKRRS